MVLAVRCIMWSSWERWNNWPYSTIKSILILLWVFSLPRLDEGCQLPLPTLASIPCREEGRCWISLLLCDSFTFLPTYSSYSVSADAKQGCHPYPISPLLRPRVARDSQIVSDWQILSHNDNRKNISKNCVRFIVENCRVIIECRYLWVVTGVIILIMWA